MKNIESKKELRQFVKLMEVLSNRHHYSAILDDFLVMCLNAFTIDGCLEADHTRRMGGYNQQEKTVLKDMFYEMIKVYNEMIDNDGQWYDFFGNLYMFIASNWKQSSLGQFFTPETVVEFMVGIQGATGGVIGKGKTVSDPACGSGRFLIAYHAKYPGNYTYGEDLDPICAKMTALNMMLHGCEGEVVCHDSILMNWNFGFKINPQIRTLGLPHIAELKEAESFIMRVHQHKIKAIEPIKHQPQIINLAKQVKGSVKEHQLQLFG